MRKVYVCQLAKPKKCDFWLWDDEAKTREEAVLLKNSRTEHPSQPITPPRNHVSYGLPTPQTNRQQRSTGIDSIRHQYSDARIQPPNWNSGSTAKEETQYTMAPTGMDDDEFFDWPLSGDEEVNNAVDQASQHGNHPETPRKSAKLNPLSSPTKRSFSDFHSNSVGTAGAVPTPATSHSNDKDVFITPATSRKGNLFDNHTPSIIDTPTKIRYPDLPRHDSDLASEILASLHSALSAPLHTEAREEIKEICNRYSLQTKGILKGRDVSRAIVKKKEENIVELQQEIERLKAQKEIDDANIRTMKQEIAVLRAGK